MIGRLYSNHNCCKLQLLYRDPLRIVGQHHFYDPLNPPLLTNLDAEKNKYFKIVADPAALYSKTAVRKRKAEEAVATEAARVEKANRERVTRSVAVGKLDRELGRGNGKLDAQREFVGAWRESVPVDRLKGTPRWRVFDVDLQNNKVVYCEFSILFYKVSSSSSEESTYFYNE